MHFHYDRHLSSDIVTINPGEYYASDKDIVIATLLGSCISVALYDPENGIGGINHFMLPNISQKITFDSPKGKYGIHAMELLINEIFKLGSPRHKLVAKIFGGGSIISNEDGSVSSVAANNIEFAFNYLYTEDIRIISADVGGVSTRKIFFYPKTGKVLLKRIGSQRKNLVSKEEQIYLEKIEKESKKWGEFYSFK